jgi:DNA topoisomerase-1
MSSLPKGVAPDQVDLEMALALLSLPREVTKHPETGDPIKAGIGRFGPYVQHGKVYASLGKDDDVLTVGPNRAIDLIIAKETGAGRGGGGRGAPAGRPLGEHPDGGPVTVHAGKYGPYVKHGSVNATLPKSISPETVTLEDAIPLLAARAEASGKKKSGAKKAPAKKAPAKKAAAKKAPAKKAETTAKKPATKKTATGAAKKPASKKAAASE